MQMLKSAGEVRGFIESAFVQLDDMVADSVASQVQAGLDEKRRSFSGSDYLDQIEKNAIYLCEGFKSVSAACSHYLCAGEPLLSPKDIDPFVLSIARTQAQRTTPFHLSYLRSGACPGCEFHSDHGIYSNWRDLRQSGDSSKYIEEMEFGYGFYQSLLITGKILLTVLLKNQQAAGIARWVPAAEVLGVVRERIDIRANIWSGNARFELPELLPPGNKQEKIHANEGKKPLSVLPPIQEPSSSQSNWASVDAAQETQVASSHNPLRPQTDGVDAADEHMERGGAWLAQGQWKQAAREYQAAVRLNRKSAMSYWGLAMAFKEQGQLRKAIRSYKKALKLDPTLVSARLSLGLIYQQRGQVGRGIKEFEAALRIEPNNADVHYRLASAYALSGRLNDAMKEYQLTLRINPEYPGAHHGMGLVLTTGQRWEEAVREWEAELRVNPSAGEPHLLLAIGYRTLGRLDEARREFLLAERAGLRPSKGWSDSVQKIIDRGH